MSTHAGSKIFSSLILTSLNARSLLNKKNELEIRISEHNSDICCITETWTTPETFSESEFSLGNKFKVFASHRQGKSKGGGTLVMVKENIQCKQIVTKSVNNHEIAAVDVYLSLPIRIFCIYRPPSGDTNTFNEILNELDMLTTDRTIILGDFNLPHYDWVNHRTKNQMEDIFITIYVNSHLFNMLLSLLGKIHY